MQKCSNQEYINVERIKNNLCIILYNIYSQGAYVYICDAWYSQNA